MPRQERTKSGTGIYHVMLRGINRQDIFEDDEDYLQMIVCFNGLTQRYDENGVTEIITESPSNYFNFISVSLLSNYLRHQRKLALQVSALCR